MLCTDRLFWSVLDTWKSVMTLPTDVKELIPEFYSDPSFLINNEKLNFGDRAAGASHPTQESSVSSHACHATYLNVP